MADEITIRVHPPTVPTTASEFHATATHVDALGMPVAFSRPFPDEPEVALPPDALLRRGGVDQRPRVRHVLQGCYGQVDPAFGNHPLAPYRTVEEVGVDG